MLEPVDHQYVNIGYVARSHGVDGTILMIPEFYAPSLFDDIDLVRIENTRGDLVPARIESVRAQEKENRLSFFVKFDHITDRNEADALKKYRIYCEQDKVEHLLQDDTAASLSSYEVQDEDGQTIGTVASVIQNPAQDILVVQGDDTEIMVPLVEEYIISIDDESSIIHCRNLHQLSNL